MWGKTGVRDHTYQADNFCAPHVRCGRVVSPLWKRMVVLHYLRLIEGVSCTSSSYMWGSWYFPSFLLSNGSFTQMYMASFLFIKKSHVHPGKWQRRPNNEYIELLPQCQQINSLSRPSFKNNFCDSELCLLFILIKEAIYIQVNDPPLNRNLEKYQLPNTWHEVLQTLLY